MVISLVVGLLQLYCFTPVFLHSFLLHKTIFCITSQFFFHLVLLLDDTLTLSYLYFACSSNFAHLTNNHLSHIMFCLLLQCLPLLFLFVIIIDPLSLVLSQSIARINIYLFHLFSCFFIPSLVYFLFLFSCVFSSVFYFLNLPYVQIKSLFLLIFSFFLALFYLCCRIFSLSLLFCKLFPQVINNKSYTIIIIINNETNVLPMVPA